VTTPILDRTGQVWEDVFGGRSSTSTVPPDECEGPFLVTLTEPELKYHLFEQHRCLALRTGQRFTLFESPGKRWEGDPEMERVA
jgi:hypothetical protein